MQKQTFHFGLLSTVFVAANFIRVLVTDPRGLGDAGWIYLLLNLMALVGWSIAGIISVSFLLFFHNLIRPDNSLKPSLWAKASAGVIAGVFLWPAVEQWLVRVVKGF